VNKRLAHGYPAHFTYALVVPVAQTIDRLGREAPRFTPKQQHRKHATSVHLPLEPLRDITSTEERITQRTKGLGGFLDSGIYVVVI